MTDKLPPQLLGLFAPRPPLKYKPPLDYALEDRKTAKIDGVGAFLKYLNEPMAELTASESPLARRDRLRAEKQEQQRKRTEEDFQTQYKPKDDKNIRGSGFETLFVSRLSYNTTTDDLMNHFKRFGRIERIRIPVGTGENDKKHAGKPRGYAFVQFEREEDMKAAYKASEELRLGGRKLVVDVERGRTVRGWRPRRFGGGLGGRHYSKDQRPQHNRFGGPPAGPGFQGGFRGGFRGGRGGFDRGGHSRGYGGAPSDAPAGPRSGGYGGGGGGGGFNRGPPRNNANYEPVGQRSNYRDREPRRYEGGDRYEDRRRY